MPEYSLNRFVVMNQDQLVRRIFELTQTYYEDHQIAECNPYEGYRDMEIFSWWLIPDNWAAEKFCKKGEIVINLEGYHYWGRHTFGQALEYDEVIKELMQGNFNPLHAEKSILDVILLPTSSAVDFYKYNVLVLELMAYRSSEVNADFTKPRAFYPLRDKKIADVLVDYGAVVIYHEETEQYYWMRQASTQGQDFSADDIILDIIADGNYTE